MNNYLSEAQERAKQIWRTEREKEAFISGVQWLIMQPEIVKLLDLHSVSGMVCENGLQTHNCFAHENMIKGCLECPHFVKQT